MAAHAARPAEPVDDAALLKRSIRLLWDALDGVADASDPRVRLAYDIWAGFASGTFLLED